MTNTDLIQILQDAKDLLTKSSDPQMGPAVDMLLYRLHTPQSYVALIGETSSGKSTLINSFLERKLLPAEAKPTTGTVVCVRYGLKEEETYGAINRDATFEELDIEQFRELAKHPDADLLRLETDQPGKKTEFTGLTVFDTPGFNSIISEHEEVVKEFLPNCDIVVFTVLYRTGFTMLDQHLMSMIDDFSTTGKVPVLLVINRVPEGIGMTDNRIREIRSHAEDTLHRKPECILIRSAMPDPEGKSGIPETDALWKAVSTVAFSEERDLEIRERSQYLIQCLIQQRLNELDGKLLSAENKDPDQALPYFQKAKKELFENQKKSYEIIDRTFVRLRNEMPHLLEKAKEDILQTVRDALENQSDWTDGPTTRAYVVGHVIPFAAYQAVKEMENYLKIEMKHLDEELSQLANTVFEHINKDIMTVENPEIKKLLQNLLVRLGTQIAERTANGLLGMLGGACGSAAGLGNLAKMIVKRIGNLFGKTFSRTVYTAIGKFFTKKMVQALGVALQIVIEGIDYLLDAKTWKKRLLKKTEKAVENWYEMVYAQCFEDQFKDKKLELCILNALKDENIKNVDSVYAGLISSVDAMMQNVSTTYDESEIETMKKDRNELQTIMNKLENIPS